MFEPVTVEPGEIVYLPDGSVIIGAPVATADSGDPAEEN
jgi:hypothetical protein